MDKLHKEKLLATRRWRKNNPSKARKSSYRSTTKIFLQRYADKNELKKCKKFIDKLVKNQSKSNNHFSF